MLLTSFLTDGALGFVIAAVASRRAAFWIAGSDACPIIALSVLRRHENCGRLESHSIESTVGWADWLGQPTAWARRRGSAFVD